MRNVFFSKTNMKERLSKMKGKLVLGIGILLLFCLVGCTGGGTSALVGKWVDEEHGTIYEFFKDGSGTVYGGGFKWEVVENGHLRLIRGTSPGYQQDLQYEISGSILTIGEQIFKKTK